MIILNSEKKNVFLRASISDVCNFDCEYCPKDLGMENHTPTDLSRQGLSSSQYIENMRRISKHGFHIISFTGGEPLLNPEFPKILEGCRETFDTIEITTNGSLALKYAEDIKKNIDVLKISIDAYDADLLVNIAGNPHAENTKRVIEELCSAGISCIGLNFVYMKKNRNELPKLVQFARELMIKYKTKIYISVLDLYYSKGNRSLWKEQFVNLKELRDNLKNEGKVINHRIRIGCDSFYVEWDGVLVNMKDSFSCTHRMDLCSSCDEYCQEGIYSLKHSNSGWISVCPSNNPNYGGFLKPEFSEEQAHQQIDYYVEILNNIKRVENTGEDFKKKNGL